MKFIIDGMEFDDALECIKVIRHRYCDECNYCLHILNDKICTLGEPDMTEDKYGVENCRDKIKVVDECDE